MREKPKCFGSPGICRECLYCSLRVACFEELEDGLEWAILIAPATAKEAEPTVDYAAQLVSKYVSYEGARAVFAMAQAIPKTLKLEVPVEVRPTKNGYLSWLVAKRKFADVVRADGRGIKIRLVKRSKLLEAVKPELAGKQKIVLAERTKNLKNLAYLLSLALKEHCQTKRKR